MELLKKLLQFLFVCCCVCISLSDGDYINVLIGGGLLGS